MKLLTKSEKTPVPVNQPTGWPRLYLIPETSALDIPTPASNDSAYHESVLIKLDPQQETRIQRFIRIEKEIFRETCADTWAALKQAGRDTAHWLARWVILPMAVACIFWIPFVNPAELPM